MLQLLFALCAKLYNNLVFDGALRRATSLLLIHLPTWSHEGNRIIGLLE